ncbi:pilus assembly FimT family protein [Cellulosilyticum sp. I15G10I2]|uniref:pilus assembly FimT family protein n=1 Tax=Cellulosilyticum sp. I15G10I2 TaxID=1892843 RepID=UPI00085CADF2|nr:type II secretion system protein [Cellulosilyticum sp. I15G10I2]
MNQKGFTLLEIVVVTLLVTIGGSCIKLGMGYAEEIRFTALVKEVERGIRSAQHMANLTGREYNIVCTEKAVYIRSGIQPAIYKFSMDKHVTIPRDITGKQISFAGKMAPSKGGTIELVNKALSKRARITIRVATGKTTVYFEKL